MNNPYHLLDTRTICESGVFHLREDLVEGPGQKRFTFTVAEIKSGSSILPVTDDGYVYLIREHKYAIGRTSIEVASGAIEEGESELSDVWALANGYITISPVSFNMTDQNTLAKLHEMMTVNEFSHHVRSSK